MQDASGRKQTCTLRHSSRRDRITIDAGGCKGNPTDTVTFMRGLLIELTAQDAMTLGFGFETDGDVSLNGNPPMVPSGSMHCCYASLCAGSPYVNLDVDQPTDICGDIDADSPMSFGSSLHRLLLVRITS
jgi:hypothetical protein